MKEIPILNADTFRYVTALAGKQFVLRFSWDARAASWYLDVGLVDGTWLALGVRVVVGWPLLFKRRDERLPAGHFYAKAVGGGGEIERREDLGDRVKLFFIPQDEVPALPPSQGVKVVFP